VAILSVEAPPKQEPMVLCQVCKASLAERTCLHCDQLFCTACFEHVHRKPTEVEKAKKELRRAAMHARNAERSRSSHGSVGRRSAAFKQSRKEEKVQLRRELLSLDRQPRGTPCAARPPPSAPLLLSPVRLHPHAQPLLSLLADLRIATLQIRACEGRCSTYDLSSSPGSPSVSRSKALVDLGQSKLGVYGSLPLGQARCKQSRQGAWLHPSRGRKEAASVASSACYLIRGAGWGWSAPETAMSPFAWGQRRSRALAGRTHSWSWTGPAKCA
jgi:hypothetical protein